MSWPWIVRILACPKHWTQDLWEWTSLVTAVSHLAWSHQECRSFLILFLPPQTASTRHDTKDRDVIILWHWVRPGKKPGMALLRHQPGLTLQPRCDHQTRSRKASRKSPVQAKDRGGRSEGLQPRIWTTECEECCTCNVTIRHPKYFDIAPGIWNLSPPCSF